jgi:ferric-dicitrate binding protein FerR (iron transport regulator)
VKPGRCDRAWQVDAFRAGLLGARDAESFERHTRTCESCKARLEGEERLRELARELPVPEPTELGLRRLRGRILQDVGGGPRPERGDSRRRWVVAGAVVAAVGLGAVLVLWRSPAPERRGAEAEGPVASAPVVERALAGAVTAGPGARWTQARHAGIEQVELTEGSIRVKVRTQTAGERFLVALPDGEIEVRGTVFDVDVERDATRLVSVTEGVVELRLNGHDPVRLGASESWPPPSPGAVARTAPVSLVPSTVHAQAPVKSPAASASSPLPSAPALGDGADSAIEYTAAVQRLREGRYDEAAALFRAILLANPSSPQAEDASYLEAVALARAGRADAAALACEHHLARFPRSFHAREAAILIARAASQRGDCDRARSAVGPWMTADAGADIRAALGSCGPR